MDINITTDPKREYNAYLNRINSRKSVVYAACSLDRPAVPIPPSVANKIHHAVAMPRMLYGLDVCPLNNAGLEVMEQTHRQNAKIVQNLPLNTPNPAPLATLGWLSIEGQVAIMKLIFIWRILFMPLENLYRQILLHALEAALFTGYNNRLSPTVAMLDVVKKYGLVEKLKNSMYLENNSLSFYKAMIKKTVHEMELSRWRASILVYRTLHIYGQSVSKIKLNVWWNFQKYYPALYKQVSSVIAVMSGTQPKQFQCNLGNELCRLCAGRHSDKAGHILLGCEALGELGNFYLEMIIHSMPLTMKTKFINMTNYEKLIFIISGLKCEYCPEWCAIYYAIVNFVHDMYRKRKILYLDHNL